MLFIPTLAVKADYTAISNVLLSNAEKCQAILENLSDAE